MRRQRILFSTEPSFLSTGFAVYTKELLKRLQATGKYDLAELANFAGSLDPRRMESPWRYYGNQPNPGEDAEWSRYNSNGNNQFGKWRFEEVCLDFQPDIVCSWLDVWMLQYLTTSAFRPHYKLAIMPTVDSAPHRKEWLAAYADADAVFSYQNWSLEVMKNEGGGQIKTRCSASPGANYNVFKPVDDKRAHKTAAGLDPDWLIVGMVARNQKRKLYPDLFKAFRLFLDSYPDLAEKSYLYCHTSYPDLGWDIPGLIKQYGLGRKVLFTYVCGRCKVSFPSFYADVRTVCPNCNQPDAKLPNVNVGVSEEALAGIYNLFDVYVQYHQNEGFCVPLAEGGYCGLPLMAVDYSAPSDILHKTGGTKLKPLAMYLECEVQAQKAVPDNATFADELYSVFSKTAEERKEIGESVRRLCFEHFNYDKTAQAWMDYFDSVPIQEPTAWQSPPRLHNAAQEPPQNIPPQQFIEWAFANVLGEPHKSNSYFAQQLSKYLNWGMIPNAGSNGWINELSVLSSRPNWQGCDMKTIINILTSMCNERNYWEQRRTGMIQVPLPPWIQQTHIDTRIKGGT